VVTKRGGLRMPRNANTASQAGRRERACTRSTRSRANKARSARTWRRVSSDLRPMSRVMCSAPAGLQCRHQPPAGGDDDGAMAGAHQCLGNLERGTFDPAGFQRGQQLHKGQAAHGPATDPTTLRQG
jgi:hypothetical protein